MVKCGVLFEVRTNLKCYLDELWLQRLIRFLTCGEVILLHQSARHVALVTEWTTANTFKCWKVVRTGHSIEILEVKVLNIPEGALCHSNLIVSVQETL
jgi:hypothetical protein